MDPWFLPDKSTLRIWSSLKHIKCNSIKIVAPALFSWILMAFPFNLLKLMRTFKICFSVYLQTLNIKGFFKIFDIECVTYSIPPSREIIQNFKSFPCITSIKELDYIQQSTKEMAKWPQVKNTLEPKEKALAKLRDRILLLIRKQRFTSWLEKWLWFDERKENLYICVITTQVSSILLCET